ncbi:hypothetical protein ACOSP7_000969 [Xanthoceras sorbifolium]
MSKKAEQSISKDDIYKTDFTSHALTVMIPVGSYVQSMAQKYKTTFAFLGAVSLNLTRNAVVSISSPVYLIALDPVRLGAPLKLERMADNEGEENTSRGNEWEVVSLTASTYAAAPGPKNAEQNDDGKSDAAEENEAGTSHALFMSGHFVFPPSEHENLPLEPEPAKTEIHNEPEGKDVISEFDAKEGGKDVISEFDAKEGGRSSGKDDEENWTKELSVHNEFPGIQFFDEKGNKLSIHGTDFEEGTTLKGLNLSDKEESIYSAANFSSFHGEAALSGSIAYDENIETPELTEPSEQGLDLSADASNSKKPAKDDEHTGSDLPCEAWWKRRAASFCAHAKEANTIWSIFIAAAVMGIVVIGQRWQQERWQALQLKWQISINDEKASRMLGPITRLKDAIVGGHRRGSFVRGSSTSDN